MDHVSVVTMPNGFRVRFQIVGAAAWLDAKEGLKVKLPPSARIWEASSKSWIISDMFEDELREWASEHFKTIMWDKGRLTEVTVIPTDPLVRKLKL